MAAAKLDILKDSHRSKGKVIGLETPVGKKIPFCVCEFTVLGVSKSATLNPSRLTLDPEFYHIRTSQPQPQSSTGGGTSTASPSTYDADSDARVSITVENEKEIWEKASVTDDPRPENTRNKPWKVYYNGRAAHLSPNCEPDLSFLEFFKIAYPFNHLITKQIPTTNRRIAIAKAEKLKTAYLADTNPDYANTNPGEIIKFFGVVVAMCFLEFDDMIELFTDSHDDYGGLFPLPNFKRFGMTRTRFEILRRYFAWGGEDYETGTGSDDDDGGVVPSANERWKPVYDFLDAINKHKVETIIPSSEICIDESISRWYARGGHWTDKGLPMYASMDKKPESGCEIWTCCDGLGKFLYNLEIVSVKEEVRQRRYEGRYSHGTAVTLRLVEPLFNTGRAVYGDSFFASVECANSLRERGLFFTGVVKSCTSNYPVKLSGSGILEPGQHTTYITKPDTYENPIIAHTWVDKDRLKFISTQGTSLPGESFSRKRIRPISSNSIRSELQIIERDTTVIVDDYFKYNAAVDEHNRVRQDCLNIEKKVEVKDFEFRVNSSLFGMVLCDSYYMYAGTQGLINLVKKNITPKDFFKSLAYEMIHNTIDQVGTETRASKRYRYNIDKEEEEINPRKILTNSKLRSNGCPQQLRCRAKACHKTTIYYCS
eukprot:Pgem_evm1s15193